MALDLKNIKGKKLTKKNLNLILALAGVFILLITYFIAYSSLSEKKEAMATQLDERTTYMTQLKEYYNNLSKYESGTNESKAAIATDINRLPVGLKNEDFLLWLMRTDEKIGCKTSSISFSSDEMVTTFNTFVDGKFRDVDGYRASATANMTMTYQQFKDYLAYVYDADTNYTFVDSVSVSFNTEDAKLSAVFNLSKYYIDFEGSTYVGEKGYDVPIGKTNPFSSK